MRAARSTAGGDTELVFATFADDGRSPRLRWILSRHPNIMVTILSNLTREFSERLRHANEEIGVLEA